MSDADGGVLGRNYEVVELSWTCVHPLGYVGLGISLCKSLGL